MREILFRGKRLDDGEWIYGYLSREDMIVVTAHCGLSAEFLINRETVCQYTGLKDKNGKRIFDGDICTDGRCTVRVHWNKHGWYCEVIKGATLSERLSFPLWQWDMCRENGYRQLEVIGNVWDNPELLEATK